LSDLFDNYNDNSNKNLSPNPEPIETNSPPGPNEEAISQEPVSLPSCTIPKPVAAAPLNTDAYQRPVSPTEAEGSTPHPLYKISPAQPPDWSDYTLPPLEEDELLPEEEASSGWKTAWAVIREVGETVILTLIIFFIIQTFVRNFRVVGTSMVNNLHDGQYLIIDKVSYSNFFVNTLGISGPQRGDVIVFVPPNRPDDDYVKRVIGLPGETVEIINGQVFINSEPLAEPFQPNPGSYTIPPQVIPEGQIFVLGDNRNNSNDSHTWGSLPIENIVGRAWLSYWPPSMWGTIPRDEPSEQATLKHFVENLVPNANAETHDPQE
jgi:signal peptidase I